jgi:hypothetical protein
MKDPQFLADKKQEKPPGEASASAGQAEPAKPKKLVFDLETGDLLVRDDDPGKSGVVVDQIYHDGFFQAA